MSGNPLAVTAGIAVLQVLRQDGVYDELERKSMALEQGLREAAREAGVEVCINRVGSLLCSFFTGEKVIDYATANSSNTARFAAFFKSMLKRGIYLAPSQFESAFISLVHGENEIEYTIEAAKYSFREALKI